MSRRRKRLFITIGACTISLILGLGISYIYFGIIKANEVEKVHLQELESLKLELGGSCYVINKNVKEGSAVSAEDFRKVKIPASLSSDSLITDLSKIKGSHYSRDIAKNAAAHVDMFYEYDSIAADMRRYELSALILPINIQNGDYVDIRINFPSGLDYVVLSKKKIENIARLGEGQNAKEVTSLMLSGEEILRISSALVDAYITKGTYLYTTVYVAHGNQRAAKVTYPSNEAVQKLMQEDPNVIQKANLGLESEKRAILSRTLEGIDKKSTARDAKDLRKKLKFTKDEDIGTSSKDDDKGIGENPLTDKGDSGEVDISSANDIN